MDVPKTYNFSKTKAVLAEIQNVLKCHVCKDIAVNPFSLGQCSHFFCKSCLGRSRGGRCLAPGCSASAPAKDASSNKFIHSFTCSLFKIGEILGEQIPDRLKEQMVTPTEDILTSTEDPVEKLTPANNKITKRKRSPAVSNHSEEESEKIDLNDKNSRQVSKRSRSMIPVAGSSEQGDSKFKSPTPQRRSKTVLPPPSTEDKSNFSTRKKPASLEKKNRKGESALHTAAVKGDDKTVLKLLEQGANPNTVDNAGWSPLHEASIAGREDIVRILLNYGASPNLHAQEENLTPLHDAVSNGFVNVVRLLVSHGADIKAKNSRGLTPREVAVSKEIISALEETPLEMTDSQVLNQSVVQQDILLPENIVLSCPQSSDTDFKKITAAAAKLKLRKPSRALTLKTTHCLLDSSKNVNYIFSAQLVGAELITSEWIYQSRMLGVLVDTEPFLLQSSDLIQSGRTRSKDCRVRGQPKLFTGLHFYLTGGFDKPNCSKNDLQKLVSLSGAKLLKREPDPENLPVAEKTVPHHAEQNSSLSKTSHIILYQEGGKREPLLKYNMEHVKTIPLIWFLQCILHHQLLEPKIYL